MGGGGAQKRALTCLRAAVSVALTFAQAGHHVQSGAEELVGLLLLCTHRSGG